MAGWGDYLALGDSYDWASFTLANGQTNNDLKANQSALFKNLPQAKGCVIISDQPISVKINNTAYPAMSITVAQMPWEFLGYKIIKDIYLSNSSGSDANVEVLLL